MPSHNDKYGAWSVDIDKVFDRKLDALRYASQTGGTVRFHYHNSVWRNFDRSLLGKVSLPELYRQRALQLRDKYEYLVLHYSGGSDSHNILHTFISNGIKLDEVSTKWAKPLRDGKFYTANNVDTSAANAASEWDFTIKPALQALASSNPEIKINVYDFSENIPTVTADEMANRIIGLNAARGALGTMVQRLDPNIDDKVTHMRGPKVGHIFGVEKPLLSMADGKIYANFVDTGMETSLMIRGQIEQNAELFYWSPDLPLLPMEQAYQVASWFKANVQARSMMWTDEEMSAEKANQLFNNMNLFMKDILYPHSWDKQKFQVSKPNAARSDWWHWIHNHREFEAIRSSFVSAMSDITQGIDKKYLLEAEGVQFLKPIPAWPVHILTL